MTFVCETFDEVASREMEEKVSKFQIVLSLSPYFAIDRARDIVFLDLGGKGSLPPQAGEPPTYYAMFWKDLAIVFEGHRVSTFSDASRIEMSVNLLNFALPISLKDDLPKIQLAVNEAMSCYMYKSLKRPAIVSIQFPQPNFI